METNSTPLFLLSIQKEYIMTIEELRKNLPKLTEQELQFCMFLMNKDKIETENQLIDLKNRKKLIK